MTEDIQDARGPQDPGAPTGQVDAPLARTLRFGALRRRPTQAEMTRVQREAALGAYGTRWREAVDGASPAPLTMALWVGSLFSVFIVITVVVMLVRGDGESALIGLGFAAVTFAVTGAIAFLVAAVVRRRRWVRHTRVATFATENGLELLLVAAPTELPPLVRDSGPLRSVVHGDLVIGAVRGQTLLTGTRTGQLSSGDTSETKHLVWAALRLDPARPARLPSQASVTSRLREQRRGVAVHVRYDEWFTVGYESASSDVAVIETLLGTLDLALRD